MRPDTHTHSTIVCVVFCFFIFVFLWRCRFCFLFAWRVRGTFFSSASRWCAFLPYDHGLDFHHQLIVVVVVVSHIQRIGCQPEKTTLHGGQSRSWSAEQGKENKRKSLAAYPPPPTPHTARSEKINKITRRIYRRYAGGRSRVRTRIPSARRLGLWVWLRKILHSRLR